MRYMPRGRRA